MWGCIRQASDQDEEGQKAGKPTKWSEDPTGDKILQKKRNSKDIGEIKEALPLREKERPRRRGGGQILGCGRTRERQ